MAAAFPELRDVTVSLKQYISFTQWDDIGRFLRLLTQARSSQLKTHHWAAMISVSSKLLKQGG